jgi:integrase/recombinase XerD
MNDEQLSQYCQLLNKQKYSESTIKNYYSTIIQFKKWNSLGNDLSQELLLDYVEELNNNQKSFSYIKNSVSALMLFSEWILGIQMKNDFLKKIKRRQKLPNILSMDEIRKLIESIDNLKHKAIISTIYACGLRISECINLKVDDIDTSRMLIKIAQANEKKDRYIQLSKKLLPILREYYKYYKPNLYLFGGQVNEKYSPKSIQAILKYALHKSNIKKDITVYSLRHSFATHLVEQGVDIHFISELLGLKDIRTTQIYLQLSSVNISNIKNPFDSL